MLGLTSLSVIRDGTPANDRKDGSVELASARLLCS